MTEPIERNGVDVHFDESQRQMVLLALAKLAMDRPGWMEAVAEIAKKMDNIDSDNNPELFTNLHRLEVLKGVSVKFVQLCWTDTTLYAVDDKGRAWFIEMRSGKWALHGNPTEADAKVEK